MNITLRAAIVAASLALSSGCATAAPSSSQSSSSLITLYDGASFGGRTYSTDIDVPNLKRSRLDNRASSVVVTQGRWQLCDDTNFRGTCLVLRSGRYASLEAVGLNNRVSSIREVAVGDGFGGRDRFDDHADRRDGGNSDRHGNHDYDDDHGRRDGAYGQRVVDRSAYRRRGNERLYQAPVTSAWAVMGAPEERCWIEREQVRTDRGGPNTGGAVVGAIIGGILGHQIVGGRSQGIATAGGAVAGALIGANVGRGNRDRRSDEERDVRRCETAAAGPPAYWDVTYEHRNVEHRVQMTSRPGASITVNRYGEPRE